MTLLEQLSSGRAQATPGSRMGPGPWKPEPDDHTWQAAPAPVRPPRGAVPEQEEGPLFPSLCTPGAPVL